ncbi:helix-turn-helix domain-containing protein [Priestia flexa]|uniref:helix-turn-helix domain-containing protein n=1 Tax=Bacillaceae TaxID=186817 RepID=UPI001E40E0C0|nr:MULTISPECIES: helix-turn-helix domain-containing protein [Bacillaceae]MCP1191485.1 helix-turn-helix domain-containing protein [Priestia flexa]UGB31356.1 helix-turn-helix domain-containing protein [Metabacillus sp. B2-18]
MTLPLIGVDEASKLWGLSPGTIKNYCADGKIISKKIGKTWVIYRKQDNPSKLKKFNDRCH